MYFPRAVPKLVTGGRDRAILRSCSGRWWPFRELPYALPPTRSCIRRGSPNAPCRVSSPSTRTSVVLATPLNAIMRDEGNGHGWEPRYLSSPISMPTSSLASRRHACSRFSPASTNPAETEYRPLLRHALLCCSSRRSSWSTIAVITAGSIRGNSKRLPSSSFVHVLSPAAERRFDGARRTSGSDAAGRATR